MDKSKVYLWIPGLNVLLFCPLCPLLALYPGAGRIQRQWAVLAKQWPTDALDSLQSPRKQTWRQCVKYLNNKSKGTLVEELSLCMWDMWKWTLQYLWPWVSLSILVLGMVGIFFYNPDSTCRISNLSHLLPQKELLYNPGCSLRNAD